MWNIFPAAVNNVQGIGFIVAIIGAIAFALRGPNDKTI